MKKRLSRETLLWTLMALAGYLGIGFFIKSNIINGYYQITLFMICINIILAVSLNLVIGFCGQFSLGHAGFMCIGAYCSALITKMMPNYAGMALGIIAGIIVSLLASLLIAIPTLRLKGDYLAIATLGFSEIIRIVVLNLDMTNKAAGLSNIPKLTTWTVVFMGVVATLLIVVNLIRSASGRAWISIREDELASEAMGIDVTRYKTVAFAIGAMLASVAGALYANYFYVVNPETFNIAKSIDILVIVVFGGMGSVTGSVMSSAALGVINMLLQNFSSLRMVIYALTIMLIMIFCPGGLLKTKEFTFSRLFKARKGDSQHDPS